MLPERSLSAQRVAEVLEEGVHIFLIYGVADPGALLVHGDEPGGDQGVHVVGDGGGGKADVLRQVLAAEGAGLQQLDDIQPPLVGDGLQPVGEVLGVVAVAADQLAQLVMVDAGEEVHGAAGGQLVPDQADAVEEAGAGADHQGLHIDALKADLKTKKAALKSIDKEIARIEAKKVKAETKAAESAKKAEAEDVLKKLLASGVSADDILAKLK